MVTLNKKELTLLNKVLGLIQEEAMGASETLDDVIESDEFNALNEKLAEMLADS